MKLIKTFFLFVFFLPFLVSAETISLTTITSNFTGSQGGTLTNNLPFTIECPDTHEISRIRIPVDSSTGSLNVTLFQATTTLKTDTVTASDNFLPSTFVDHTFTTPVPCNTNTYFVLTRTSGAGNLLIPSVDTTNTGQYASISSVYAYATSTTDYLTVLVDTQYQLSNGDITYVPIDTQLESLECINNTPTTTCSFGYSTTTATSTIPDYTLHFDYMLLIFSVILFGCIVLCFRYLTKKYL